jgi:c-di-GMP-binding flagellar brake protein YcgR
MFGIKPKTKGDPRARLPQPQTLVECQVMHGATSSITVEAVGSKTITTTTMPGFAVGKTVILTYANAMGRFRFGAKVAGVRGEIATLAMPTKIDTLSLASGGAQKRASVRLDTTVPTTWRFAPNGKGYGESYRGSLSDVSRTGASLIADREARMHAMVELKMQLSSSSPALVLLGEVMRVGKIEQSGKSSHGLRFHGVTANDDKAIMDFINRRQADRRSRGLM